MTAPHSARRPWAGDAPKHNVISTWLIPAQTVLHTRRHRLRCATNPFPTSIPAERCVHICGFALCKPLPYITAHPALPLSTFSDATTPSPLILS